MDHGGVQPAHVLCRDLLAVKDLLGQLFVRHVVRPVSFTPSLTSTETRLEEARVRKNRRCKA